MNSKIVNVIARVLVFFPENYSLKSYADFSQRRMSAFRLLLSFTVFSVRLYIYRAVISNCC